MIFMKEIEVKILEINRPKIEKALINLQARKIFDGVLKTLFLDFGDNSIIKAGNVLRLRKNSQKSELTFKKVTYTQTVKIAEEYSVKVSDVEIMLKILQNLGLSVTGMMEKHRFSYKLDNVRFDIDRYLGDFEFIPEFLEIEAEDLNNIHRYAELLGFKPEDCLPWSSEELIQHYSNDKEKNRKRLL
jgi:adenylate cyclase, class 2